VTTRPVVSDAAAATLDAPVSTHEAAPQKENLGSFLDRYVQALRRFLDSSSLGQPPFFERGMPPSELRALLATQPLSVFIPEVYGGRGGEVAEGLAMLERTSYESLPLSLTMGINGALFLQPVAKYADEGVKQRVFARFLEHQSMGGLMMTEPGFGSDALSMQTSWVREADRYRIRGTKHWAGLTGLADFWLMTARERSDDRLGRDVDFFVLDGHDPEQSIVVEERFENLGLHAIPYGRNHVDVAVPEAQRLTPTTTGLKMMLDLLHRSRLQFPGMGLGFLQRLADDALHHVRERMVGGKSLLEYDQVKRRIAELQASVTVASAMCLHASERAGLEHDLARDGLLANVVKSVLTDRMQAAAQSVLQLVGAAGYSTRHRAGLAVVDSRPFQIFEGSNDILYEQVGASVLQAMRRAKEARLGAYLAATTWASRASQRFGDVLDVRLDTQLPQRRLVDLGKAIGRIATLDMVEELAARGYPARRIEQAVQHLGSEVTTLFASVRSGHDAEPSQEVVPVGHWLTMRTT